MTELWNSMLTHFPILRTKFSIENDRTKQTIYRDFTIFKDRLDGDFFEVLYSVIFKIIEENITKNANKLLWAGFESCTTNKEIFRTFRENISKLYVFFAQYYTTMYKLEEVRQFVYADGVLVTNHLELPDCIENLRDLVSSNLLMSLPINYKSIIKSILSVHYKTYCKLHAPQNDSNQDSTLLCSCCECEIDRCQCDSCLSDYEYIYGVLMELSIAKGFIRNAAINLAHKEIDNKVVEVCKGTFYSSNIETLDTWYRLTVEGWIKEVLKSKDAPPEFDDKKNNDCSLTDELSHYMLEAHTRNLISQLFSIIIEYPESFPAIEDLCHCLRQTKLYHVLAKEVKEAFVTRLLHAGVNTADILTTYIATYRVLRHIDSTGFLLDAITTPIKMYLKGREDTVHCVVSSLTEDGPADLSEELLKATDCEMQQDEDNLVGNNYQSNPNQPSTSTDDIISVFIEMFGSKQCFIDEYRKLLADRVLTKFSCNMEKEQRCLELLKIRFGETELLKCEVMLKDMSDSTKIANLINNDETIDKTDSFIKQAIVISSQFWPPFKDTQPIILPDEIKKHFDNYKKGFEKYKTNRTIVWKPHLGIVKMTITLKNRTICVTVTPLHAIIIHHFQNQSEWSIEQLEQTTGIPQVTLRKKLLYWLSQGILYEKEPHVFGVVEESMGSHYKPKLCLSMLYDEEEPEPTIATKQELKEEELQFFWSYIVGMLNNLNALTLDRIFQMLSMFAAHDAATAEITPNQLKAFLDKKVKTNKLVYHGGTFKLPK